jgi:hypothetical protein
MDKLALSSHCGKDDMLEVLVHFREAVYKYLTVPSGTGMNDGCTTDSNLYDALTEFGLAYKQFDSNKQQELDLLEIEPPPHKITFGHLVKRLGHKGEEFRCKMLDLYTLSCHLDVLIKTHRERLTLFVINDSVQRITNYRVREEVLQLAHKVLDELKQIHSSGDFIIPVYTSVSDGHSRHMLESHFSIAQPKEFGFTTKHQQKGKASKTSSLRKYLPSATIFGKTKRQSSNSRSVATDNFKSLNDGDAGTSSAINTDTPSLLRKDKQPSSGSFSGVDVDVPHSNSITPSQCNPSSFFSETEGAPGTSDQFLDNFFNLNNPAEQYLSQLFYFIKQQYTETDKLNNFKSQLFNLILLFPREVPKLMRQTDLVKIEAVQEIFWRFCYVLLEAKANNDLSSDMFVTIKEKAVMLHKHCNFIDFSINFEALEKAIETNEPWLELLRGQNRELENLVLTQNRLYTSSIVLSQKPGTM